MSFPAHSVARATLIENTLILPTLSLKKKKKIKYMIFILSLQDIEK